MKLSIENFKNFLQNHKKPVIITLSIIAVLLIVFIVAKFFQTPATEAIKLEQPPVAVENNTAENHIPIQNVASSKNRKNLPVPFSKRIQTPPINDIKIDQSGNVWLATNSGVYKLSNNELTAYTNQNNKFPFPQAECIECLQNEIFAGSLYGLCKLSKNDVFKNESDKYPLPSKVILSILWDNSNLWLATTKGVVFKNSNNQIDCLTKDSTNNGLKSDWCTRLLQFNQYLAVANDSGLSIWNIQYPAANPTVWKNLEHTKTNIPRPINDIAFDGNNIWLATPSGLILLKTSMKQLYDFSRESISYTEPNGLPSSKINTMVYHKNSLWLGTAKGLARFRNNQIQTISPLSGENPEEIRKLAVHGDILWIGTANGIQYINTAVVD